PNNPSGNLVPEKDVRRVLESVECMVFLDEAYVEFASKSLTGLVQEYDNLIVGRTLSKAFGLAGLRIGYAVVPGWVSAPYMKAMTPFAISRGAVAAGLAALGDREHLEKSIRTVIDGRARMMDGLKKLGIHAFESQANFILSDVAPRSAKDICDKLLRRGIIVRDCTSFRGAGNSLVRITVGTREQNTRVLAALGEILG
ncbi:MAG TPA: aminotransferase class I/II-fold pyridoxal phosphate-dependent enzyme, partial [Candidatus Methanoperedenaceae archaeon]|nr:aminotransferase class I/II-fold pyridoxal phosphate-dependent enzyme [Candidatus Methanoperedenaceae archaeon]